MTNLYASTSALYDELNVPASDTAGRALIDSFTLTASRFIDEFCGRKFYYEEDIVENVAIKDPKFMLLERTPLVSLTSISYDSVDLAAADYSIYTAKTGSIIATTYFNRTTRYTPTRYVVTYNGGYRLPADGLTRDLPYDIEHVAKMLVRQMYNGRSRDPMIQKRAIPQVISEQYFGSMGGDASSEYFQGLSMLKKYRRFSI